MENIILFNKPFLHFLSFSQVVARDMVSCDGLGFYKLFIRQGYHLRSYKMTVNVSLALGLDGESEQTLAVVREASRILREEYGIWVSLHIVQIWSHDPLLQWCEDIPRVVVNGIPVFKGAAPSLENFIDAVIALMDKNNSASSESNIATYMNPPRFASLAEA